VIHPNVPAMKISNSLYYMMSLTCTRIHVFKEIVTKMSFYSQYALELQDILSNIATYVNVPVCQHGSILSEVCMAAPVMSQQT
jgi:hypothetical protein